MWKLGTHEVRVDTGIESGSVPECLTTPRIYPSIL